MIGTDDFIMILGSNTMNILSIDFDYFIDTDITTRNEIFPSGEDAGGETVHRLWQEVYAAHPEIGEIGVISDYDLLCCKLPELVQNAKACASADSHREIYDFICSHCPAGTQMETEIKIVNIDFHHDNYCMYGGQVTCANWLRKISEAYDIPAEHICWGRREDSEISSLEGDFPYFMTTDISTFFSRQYDLIFLCLSPEWTPPHLVEYYERLVEIMKCSVAFPMFRQ